MSSSKIAKEIIEREITYWNEKRWRVFSWSSNLLIGSLAGATFLKKKNALSYHARLLLVIAVFSLTFYSVLWLYRSNKVRSKLREKLMIIYTEFGFDSIIESLSDIYTSSIGYSYEVTVIILGIVSSLMIILPAHLK